MSRLGHRATSYRAEGGSGRSALFFTLLPLAMTFILPARPTTTALGNIVTAEREVCRAVVMGGGGSRKELSTEVLGLPRNRSSHNVRGIYLEPR